MARIVDLNQSAGTGASVTCDVCVVGAGAAGLYLANRLAAAGLEVVVLEAGGQTCATGASIGIEAVFSATPYRAATEGRAFGWGGSTSRWGGLLIPHSELDLRVQSDPEAPAWGHIVDVVRDRTQTVFKTLRLGSKTDFQTLPAAKLPGEASAALQRANISPIASEFLPFQRRKLTYLLSSTSKGAVTVYLNAVATRWHFTPGPSGAGVLSKVEAATRTGTQLHVAAKSFVIAAGTIESTRILLEIDRATGERMIPRTAALGRYLADHLSCPIAQVVPEDRERAAKLLGPVFVRGRMRTFRFVVRDEARAVPKHFGHFIFDIDNAGFRFAKDLLFSLQAGTLSPRILARFPAAIGDLFSLSYHRLVTSKLHVAAGTAAHLQLDLEQAPAWDNRIQLDASSDSYGRPVAAIVWKVREADEENIKTVREALLSRWPDASTGFPRLSREQGSTDDPKPYDAYHPVGTCRMGSGPEATVDLDLKVKGSANLFVLSTGVLPGAGTANPTFSMLCLGDRLSEQLAAGHVSTTASAPR
jgi:choline dehydrogenase-like flavoprotein